MAGLDVDQLGICSKSLMELWVGRLKGRRDVGSAHCYGGRGEIS